MFLHFKDSVAWTNNYTPRKQSKEKNHKIKQIDIHFQNTQKLENVNADLQRDNYRETIK